MKYEKKALREILSQHELSTEDLAKASYLMDYKDAFLQVQGNTLVVSFLVDDDHASSPFEDADCYGRLIFKNESDFHSHTGVDQYGDYDEDVIDEKLLLNSWADKASKDWIYTEFVANNLFDFLDLFDDEDACERGNDWTNFFKKCAVAHHLCDGGLVAGISTGYFQSFQEVLKSTGQASLKYNDDTRFTIPVYISEYGPHTEVTFDDGLENPHEKQDSYHAVWIPGIQDNVDIILERAELYCHGQIDLSYSEEGAKFKVVMDQDVGGEQSPDFPTRREAFDWLKTHVETNEKIKGISISDELKHIGITRAACEMASDSLSLYQDYINGNIYSTYVATFTNTGTESDPVWEFVEDDYCGGCIGEDDALECLKDHFLDVASASIPEVDSSITQIAS